MDTTNNAIIAAAAAAGVTVEVVEDAPHPDFFRTLRSSQVAWCKANGITTKKSRTAGFFFMKGDRWINPIKATSTRVVLMAEDRSEDGDGARVVETFDRLRDALAALRRTR